MQTLQTIGAVALQVGLNRAALAHLIETGQIPGPSLTVPGRRLFTSTDVERIVAALAKRQTRRTRKDAKESDK